jgi:hypothetical protein
MRKKCPSRPPDDPYDCGVDLVEEVQQVLERGRTLAEEGRQGAYDELIVRATEAVLHCWERARTAMLQLKLDKHIAQEQALRRDVANLRGKLEEARRAELKRLDDHARTCEVWCREADNERRWACEMERRAAENERIDDVLEEDGEDTLYGVQGTPEGEVELGSLSSDCQEVEGTP